jgi:hypothetical protein
MQNCEGLVWIFVCGLFNNDPNFFFHIVSLLLITLSPMVHKFSYAIKETAFECRHSHALLLSLLHLQMSDLSKTPSRI